MFLANCGHHTHSFLWVSITVDFVVVRLLSRVRLCAHPGTAALRAPLSSTLSLSLPEFMPLESVGLSVLSYPLSLRTVVRRGIL